MEHCHTLTVIGTLLCTILIFYYNLYFTNESTPITINTKHSNNYAIGSDSWIQSKAMHTHNWVDYRLGDMVKSQKWRDREGGYQYHKKNFPYSIAVEYMDKINGTHASKINDILLENIISARKTQLYPSTNTLVIHLRSGDVLDEECKWKVGGYKYKQMARFLKHPISVLRKLIRKFRRNNITNVVLVTGFHTQMQTYTNSIKYIITIKEWFEKNNFSVSLRINENPDEDFMFMCNSKFFVQSPGGFSTLIARIVKMRHGTVFNFRSNVWFSKTTEKEIDECLKKKRFAEDEMQKANHSYYEVGTNKTEVGKLNNLFWQYPVITEKTFYEQNRNNKSFFGLPWATVIDEHYDLHLLYVYIRKEMKKTDSKQWYTSCQHIHFRKLIPFWKSINITTVYTPHKILNENELNGIKIKPCPLYAVNIEDPNRNELITKTNVLDCKRFIVYSFIGGYNKMYYLSDVRNSIYNLPTKNKQDVFIKNTGHWHFDCIVYHSKCELNETEKTYQYNKILLQSKYTLAPSGSGPNSIRFWEALGAGSIPVLLSDTLELPNHKLWDNAIIRINENRINEIDSILRNISVKEENERRKNCLKIYHSFNNNYANI